MVKCKSIKSIVSEIVFATEFISVRMDTIEYDDGRKDERDILLVPEGVVILPVTAEGKVILTLELRHNHGKVYSVPMGKVDKGDNDQLISAKRELKEEVGLTAKKWTHLSSHHNGVHEEGLNHFYLAEDLSHGKASMEDDEDIEKIEVTFEKAFELMNEGKIVDLRSRGAIWAGYVHLQRQLKK